MIEEYKGKLGFRFPTMQMALTLLENRCGRHIIETGTMRMADDWGAGCSTLIFAEYCRAHECRLATVDLFPRNIEMSKKLTADYADLIEYVTCDSVEYLKTLESNSVDLLYLDSVDYPYVELLDIYGGRHNLKLAMEILADLGDEEILKRHGDLILPCQLHCANEVLAAFHTLHENSIVLIDDDHIPGGGKPRLAKHLLDEKGWTEVLKNQQSLWIR